MTTAATVTPVEPGVSIETLRDLAADTPANEIKQRVAYGRGNQPIFNPDGTPKMLSYVDARYVQERLDEVVGPENWQTKFEDSMDGDGIRCSLGILVEGRGWVWKTDVGVPSNIEPVKGAHSDAFKRAAVQWGIGRDLYNPTVEEDDPASPPAPTTAPQGNIRQQTGRGQRYGSPVAQPTPMQAQQQAQVPPLDQVQLEQLAYEQNLAWECPIHGNHKIVPPGRSKKPPYREYGAFFACTERDCQEKGPRVVTS
jgi:hypothetical protein